MLADCEDDKSFEYKALRDHRGHDQVVAGEVGITV